MQQRNKTQPPQAADSIPAVQGQTIYPAPFDRLVAGRTKHKLGEAFGLDNFGVNLTELLPGAVSALLHHHSRQDEFIYILQGRATLRLGEQEFAMQAGDCHGCKAGSGVASQLLNLSNEPVLYLEIGDRRAGDEVVYPEDDLSACQGADGQWTMSHKDGRPY